MTDGDSPTPSRLGRRRFLQSCAVVATGVAAGGFIQKVSLGTIRTLNVPTSEAHDWIMVVDLNRCNGCEDCTRGCQQVHNLTSEREWIKIYRMTGENGEEYPFPRPCMQCDNPPCTYVCPVGATYARDDGVVLIDANICIGCRYCMAACPYNARYFNWSGNPEFTAEEKASYNPEFPTVHRRGTTEKCIFCVSRAPQGRLPQCVAVCQEGALYFGDRREDAVTNSRGETILVSEALRQGAFRWKEELGTEPRVYYLPRRAGL